MRLPTVKIKSDARSEGFIIINESDFDPEVHTLYEEAASGEPAESPETGQGFEAGAKYSLGEHAGAGYYVLLKGGEPVLGDDGEPETVGRGRDTAQATVDAMNERG